MDSFVAIDFETACWGVSCAVGIVHFENGEVVEQRYTLIDPGISQRRWDLRAINVHGITPADVIGQPTFADIWPELLHYASCYPFVAHNANFDMGVLRSELERFTLQSPSVRFGCSMALARSAWPRKHPESPENHKLNTLSSFLNISLDHHNALSDAVAAGMVTLAALDRLGHGSLSAAYSRAGMAWGEISPELDVLAANKW
ncbi:MAG TPA: 3'-5' exonuclease [Solirubrobacterales bacterium]|jgi:DNA polymerase-3 subunit epsilon|nr:3'-5' exonuclease [Solirubrobacterales bacterium]